MHNEHMTKIHADVNTYEKINILNTSFPKPKPTTYAYQNKSQTIRKTN